MLESDKVAKEMFRTLKPIGKLIIEGTDIEKGSKSFELTKSMGLEKAINPNISLVDDIYALSVLNSKDDALHDKVE